MWKALSNRLEGRLAVLEPLRVEHLGPLWEAAQDARIWTWFPVPPDDEAAFRLYHEGLLDEAKRGASAPFATFDATTGAPCGSTSFLALRPEHRGAEIGSTWVNPAAWGSGINIEAKLLMLQHAFERVGCMRVEFKTDARNERSRRALEALPARFEGVFAKHMVRHYGIRDSAWYAIVDDDWPTVKANLERRLAGKAAL
jgi:RimJ/RimL family protein N-acetyltransferase